MAAVVGLREDFACSPWYEQEVRLCGESVTGGSECNGENGGAARGKNRHLDVGRDRCGITCGGSLHMDLHTESVGVGMWVFAMVAGCWG